MNKFINSVWQILLYIWQLPQHICALFLLMINYKTKYVKIVDGIKIYVLKYFPKGTCVSLGNYIFIHWTLNPDLSNNMAKFMHNVIMHEHRHSIQSKYLGIFYLFVVGIPSVLLVLYKRLFNKTDEWYHKHYPESWADKLAGIKK